MQIIGIQRDVSAVNPEVTLPPSVDIQVGSGRLVVSKVVAPSLSVNLG